MSVEIPDGLRLKYRRSVEGRAWLGRLPHLIESTLWNWQLRVDLPAGADPWHGTSGMVIPVTTSGGEPAALKIAFPHEEALTEPLALRLWAGHGAVRLLRSDESSGALLLERLDSGRTLQQLPMEEATVIWGNVLQQLSIRPATAAEWQKIPRIAATAERYCDELPQRWSELNEPFGRWLLEAALEVCQTRGVLTPQSSASEVLVHTDLHFMNILARPNQDMDAVDTPAGQSRHYVAIDPQVQLGEAEFALAPCLWNRLHELPRRGAEAALRRRACALADAAGLDGELATQWAIVREVENALCYLERSGHGGDAQRSLWVASTLAGKTLPGLPGAHDLPMLC